MPVKTGMIRREKFKNQIELFFKMPFAEFVTKHFKVGMTRVDCCEMINQLSGGKVSPKTSTVWNYIKQGIKNGEITDFDFHGRKSKGSNKKKSICIKQKDIPITVNDQITTITFSCECGKKHTEERKITPENANLLLRIHKCESCGEKGLCSAEFTYGDVLVRKAIASESGILSECFVDEFGKIILNPLVDYGSNEVETLNELVS